MVIVRGQSEKTMNHYAPNAFRRITKSLFSFVALAVLTVGCDSGMMPGEVVPPPPPPPIEEKLTELDRYIKTPDPAYSWKLVGSEKGSGYTAYFLEMKSGSWRSAAEVDRTLWQHFVTIVKPDDLGPGPAVLLISGGSNGGMPPTKASSDLVNMAKVVNTIAVELKQVPNQPLTFANHDGKSHTEDGIVAFGWAQVMRSGDATWHARFPMVRAAVHAMDATQEFLKSAEGGSLSVEKFVVAGASKRGWTTWMTGAVDKRVSAIVPIVIDVLNVEKFMVQHIESYGFWANSLYDYYYNRVTEHIGKPELSAMLANEDPYLFRTRLSMPKYLLNATGDQFFLPDGSQNYFADLTGEKYLRYVPNADHSLSGSDAMESALAYISVLRSDRPRPSFSWTFEGADTLRVKTQTTPQKVLLWQASNPKARDFRVETLGKKWTSTELSDEGGGTYTAKVAMPAQGYTAFLIELHFPSGQIFPLKFSTQVRVIPEARPFAGIDPRSGKLEGEL